MLRQIFFNVLALTGLGLIIGACAAPTTAAAPTTTPMSTIHEVATGVMWSSVFAATTSSTVDAAVGESTAAVQTSSKTIPARWSPWSSSFDNALNASYCNIIVQQPETYGKIIAYPVLVFNYDFTALVLTEMVDHTKPAYTWSFPLESAWWNTMDSTHVVFVPSFKENNTDVTPRLVYNEAQYTHDRPWTTRPKAGEMVPGVQSTLFHTTFRCRK